MNRDKQREKGRKLISRQAHRNMYNGKGGQTDRESVTGTQIKTGMYKHRQACRQAGRQKDRHNPFIPHGKLESFPFKSVNITHHVMDKASPLED